MIKNSINWLIKNSLNNECIVVNHRNKIPYPEVTGYLIPTLLEAGETQLALNYASWLTKVQNKDGSFSLDNPNNKYVFDTGQVIRGWTSIINRLPELEEPLFRACNWIINEANSSTGAFMVPPNGREWSLGERGEVSEGIHLYVVKPLLDAGIILNNNKVIDGAIKAKNYYIENVALTEFKQKNMLTHFYGYIQEALFELKEFELANLGMKSVEMFQEENGAVPGYYDVNWVCSTGLAQLAKVWYLQNNNSRNLLFVLNVFLQNTFCR